MHDCQQETTEHNLNNTCLSNLISHQASEDQRKCSNLPSSGCCKCPPHSRVNYWIKANCIAQLWSTPSKIQLLHTLYLMTIHDLLYKHIIVATEIEETGILSTNISLLLLKLNICNLFYRNILSSSSLCRFFSKQHKEISAMMDVWNLILFEALEV